MGRFRSWGLVGPSAVILKVSLVAISLTTYCLFSGQLMSQFLPVSANFPTYYLIYLTISSTLPQKVLKLTSVFWQVHLQLLLLIRQLRHKIIISVLVTWFFLVIPWWCYLVAGILLLVLCGIAATSVLFICRRRQIYGRLHDEAERATCNISM